VEQLQGLGAEIARAREQSLVAALGPLQHHVVREGEGAGLITNIASTEQQAQQVHRSARRAAALTVQKQRDFDLDAVGVIHASSL